MPDPQTPLVEADSNNQIKLELPILINHGKFQSTKLDRGSWSLDHRQKPFALVVHNVRFPEKTGVFTCLVSPGGTIISCMSRLSWNQMMWWVNSLPDDQILTTDWINLYEIVSGVQSLNGYVSWPIWQAHMDRLKEPGMSIDDEPFVYSPKCFKEAKFADEDKKAIMVQSTGGYPTFEMETKEELDTVFKAAYTDQNDSIDEDIMESEEDNDFLNPELNYEKS